MDTSRRLWAEAFGTFCLVFAGTGAVVVNDVTGGGVTHVGVAATFGLVVMAMIYALGSVSGSHLNPAVTLGLCAAGRFPLSLVLPYIASQCCGALGASGVLRLLFPENATLGATLPAGPISGASMNPARSLAPAVVSMRFDSLWIYLLAPVVGAVAGVPLFRRIHPERIHPEPGDRVRHAEDL